MAKPTPQELARQKTTVISGGNNSYYLTELKNGTVVENDDINLVLSLCFDQGTSLKSLTRLCKQRMDLGKPGSTPEYEAGKVEYYTVITEIASTWRENSVGWFGKSFRFVRDLLHPGFEDVENYVIEVPHPRRFQLLDPYEFRIGDFLNALEPTSIELLALRNLFAVALMRRVIGPPRVDELRYAQDGKRYGALLKESIKSDGN